jgi:hypothetical protein
MSENIDILKDDIAFMRAMAQEGRRAPLLGGASLLAAGLIYSAATLFCWAKTAKLIVVPDFWYLGVWPVATVVYFLVMAVLIGRWRSTGKPGSAALTNRAFRWAWSAGGWAIMAIFAGSAVMGWRFHTWVVFATFPTIILAIYGAAWTISAVVSDRRWVRWVAAGCFVAAVGVTLMPATMPNISPSRPRCCC